jgi:Response regulator containing a CheY-like receiver domain and an HTH DNA-binding domain
MSSIAVGMHASNPVTAQGAARLSSYPGIDVTSAPSRSMRHSDVGRRSGNGRTIQENAINTLIVGEDVIARLGLRTLLQVSGTTTVVGDATGGQDALTQAGRLSPDVVLLHTVTSGPELLLELRELARHVPVLLLTNDESPRAVERALSSGATGYLVNGQYGPDELIAAVQATAKGQPRLSPGVVWVLVDRLRTVRGQREPTLRSELSRREVEIIEQLVRGHTNAEIARSLGISEKTVKNHVNHVYAKLRTRNRAETVALWLGPAPSPAGRVLDRTSPVQDVPAGPVIR